MIVWIGTKVRRQERFHPLLMHHFPARIPPLSVIAANGRHCLVCSFLGGGKAVFVRTTVGK